MGHTSGCDKMGEGHWLTGDWIIDNILSMIGCPDSTDLLEALASYQ